MDSGEFSSLIPIIFQALRPDPKLSIIENARDNFYLAREGNPFPGFFEVERTPYLKQIFEALSPESPYEEITLVKGCQLGGTSISLAWLNHVILNNATSCLVVFPTEKNSQRFVKKKFRPMVLNCTAIQAKINNRSIDRDSLELFNFPGGAISFGNSHAPNTLRMDSIQYLILDEVSDFPQETGQGDPVEIARGRTNNFEGRKKIYLVSTPTNESTCRITKAFEAPNVARFNYFVPCPHCNEYQLILWKNIHWSADLQVIYLECVHCKERVSEHHKTWMLGQGEWRQINKEIGETSKVGFRLSSLYAPLGMLSWKSAITQFLSSKNDPSLLRVWTNNVLGEAWREAISIPIKRVKNLVGDFAINWDEEYTQLPQGIDLITVGVDPNEHYTAVEIVGWTSEYKSTGIHYLKIHRHISSPELWAELDVVLNKKFRHWKQHKLRIASAVIDTGYQADRVYEYLRKHMASGRNIIGVKGNRGVGKPIISTQPKLTANVAKIPLYFLSSHTSNETLFSWLNVKGKDSAGHCRFPKTYPDEYFEELVAMRKEMNARKGQLLGVWVQDPSKRCEGNDCRRMAMAALFHLVHLGLDLEAHCKKLATMEFPK